MTRVYNFSAGPSMLPEPVLERAREELLDFGGTGMSVMEMSHRGAAFSDIAAHTEALLRELLAVPDNYKVLFLPGGASAQFAAIPLNLLAPGQAAAYVETGLWSQKAISEAARFSTVTVAASSKVDGFFSIPSEAVWEVPSAAAYLHYTSNETIGGVEFYDIPAISQLPLVCDMSSNILSRPLDVSRFGLIYAGAQKNMGPAGICVVIVRDDMLRDEHLPVPAVLDYRAQAEQGSMLNTPATYNWYLLGCVLEWVKQQGGLSAMAERNDRKAKKLYDAIDRSGFYSNPVAPGCRSRMNVPFRLAEPSAQAAFLESAARARLVNLEGHRSVGGLRASIYNAMPEAGVDALVEFMADFERTRA